jgi:haloacetate dehalogenase
LFEGFRETRVRTSGAEIHLRLGGKGPPLLLLHGFPQTHVMWHRLAPVLAQRFTVVCPDLRGYGASSKPAGGSDHAAYSKRAMAQDMAEVMAALGFPRFQVVGHDRGARVTHRLCLDHREAVERACVIDIAPTLTMYEGTDQAFATGYYHWFFLIQPAPLPERLIGNDSDWWVERTLGSWGGGHFDPAAVEAYKAAFRDPATLHATCEDYRAAAGIDLVHDRTDADKRIACPLLVLWGTKGLVGRTYDVLAAWRAKATDVQGHAIEGGHFLPEENPGATLAALEGFLSPPPRRGGG